MKLTRFLIPAALAATLVSAGCGKEEEDNDGNETSGGGVVDVSSNLTADTTWSKDKTYQLKTHVFVESGTLTIEAGTKVLGDSGSSLVVTKNARLVARGTAADPIVFTSARLEGTRAPGDWGGVVLLGGAKINVSGGSEKIEGFPATEDLTTYGGEDDAHDCGTIEYARIEFAGFELAKDNELNGLTLGGCGTATRIDRVQIHKGDDDGLEIFGGTVNVSHVVISQPDDDGLDWDYGWVGKAQFVVVQQNKAVGNCGIEADNNKSNNDAEPRSAPEIWNLSLIGSDAEPGMAGKTQIAMHLRRGSAGKIKNAIITHFSDFPVDVEGGSSRTQAESGALEISTSVFFDNGNRNDWPAEAMDNDSGFDEGAHFAKAELQNRFMDPRLADMLNLAAPKFQPMSGSPVMTMGATPPADGFFEVSATFAGAVGTEDWTAGWTAYPAN